MMEIPVKEEIIMTDKDENKNDINEITLDYYCSCCPCYCFYASMIIFFIVFPPLIVLSLFCFPYKKIAFIDENKKALIIHNKTIFPCCCQCCGDRIYFLNIIKKVVIYITSKPDPTYGFKKLFFMNCELISTDGQKENLFTGLKYDEHQLNEFQAFFKRYFDTEFRPESTEMDYNLTPEENQPIVTNSNDDNNIKSKPSMNEEAATPIFA